MNDLNKLTGKIKLLEAENKRLIEISNIELLGNLTDTANSIVFVKNKEEKYLLVNKSYANIFNLNISEVIGKTDIELKDILLERKINFHKSMFNLQNIEYTKNIDTSRHKNLKCKVIFPDGNEKIFKPVKTKLFDEKGIHTATLVYARDVSRVVRAEKELLNININLERIITRRSEELRLSEKNFKNLFEKSNDSIIITNFRGHIIDVNERMCKMLGYSKKELLLMKTEELMTSKFRKEYSSVMNKMKTGSYHIFETENISKNGKIIPLEFGITLLDYHDEKVVLLAGRDITGRKQMQKQVLRAILRTEESERKRFAQELHDGLGALLSGIKMYIDLIAEEEVGAEMIPDIMQKTKLLIDEAADTAREVANNIKPHVLTNLGLIKSIKILSERFTDTGKINIDYEMSDYTVKLDNDFELTIYRIVNELINNTIKHAKASKIKFNLRSNRKKLILLYSDDGEGFNVEKALSKKSNRNGLKNIMSRVETVGGTCEIMSDKNIGVYVRIKIDINDFIRDDK